MRLTIIAAIVALIIGFSAGYLMWGERSQQASADEPLGLRVRLRLVHRPPRPALPVEVRPQDVAGGRGRGHGFVERASQVHRRILCGRHRPRSFSRSRVCTLPRAGGIIESS